MSFEIATAPQVIVDAGANIGLASIYFANKYPEAKIIAIEPESGNFEVLKKNTADYESITPVQAALWNSNRRISLNDPGIGNWGFTTCEPDNAERSSEESNVEVDAVTVDRIMTDFKLDKIDILKIDIEGAEKEVFGDQPTWLHHVATLIVETHDRLKPGCSQTVREAAHEFRHHWRRGENDYFSR